MKSIGENIATLRKRKGMTQEALAAVIGVSAQSVSKWENNTNMPDIVLLPILADIFNVHIDQLFGRDLSEGCSPDLAFEAGCQALLDIVNRSVYSLFKESDFFDSEPFEKYKDECREQLKQHDDTRTAIFRGHGQLYYREKLGGLLLKKPEAGWSSLLKREGAVKVLEMLCCEDFRNGLAEVIRSRKAMFTIGTICRRCGIEDEGALEEKFRDSGMFKTHEVEVDGHMVELYEFSLSEGRLIMLYAVFAFAEEYAGYRDNYYCNSGCFSEDVMG